MSMELLGRQPTSTRSTSRPSRPIEPATARGNRAHPALDRHGRRLPALDLHATLSTPREERRAAWRGLLERFGGSVDWSGHEDARDHSWHRQLHIFLYPFYYIEYGIAQLGALQIWQRSSDRPCRRPSPTTRRPCAWAALGRCPSCSPRPGIRFDFSDQIIGPLMETIRKELEKLSP